jgi:phospholipid/cholesterol/gamma-HCH transport system permease protein
MKSLPALPERITPAYVAKARPELLASCRSGEPLRLNAQPLAELNGLAIAFFAGLQRDAKIKGSELILVGLNENFAKSLQHIAAISPPPPKPNDIPFFEKVGNQGLLFFGELKDTLLLFSESLYGSTWGLFRRKTIPKGEVITQMIRLGSSALPIVLLLSLLIGFTLAVQSGNQLQQYGATIFLADGLGVGMVTEIGPVLTAVIVAGRSGSAITAEIATMTVQEEIAALQTMAVNPIQFLVLPRFWALSLALPLLTALAAAAGIFSGLVVGYLSFNLSPQSFLSELGQAVLPYYFFQMLIKSLTFGWIIALVSVTKGLRVSGGADAVGRATTECVVTSIFSIIVADALFSFLFYYV